MFWLFVWVMLTSVGSSTPVIVSTPAANVALTTPAGRLRPSSGSRRGDGRRDRVRDPREKKGNMVALGGYAISEIGGRAWR